MKFVEYFPGNSYETPEKTSRKVLDRLFLNTRWYFVTSYLLEIMKARSLALKNLYNNKAFIESSYRIFKLIEGCGGRLHLDGLQNLRSLKGPVVFISNHMSVLETFVLPCIIAPLMEVTFVVKESLVRHFLFGPVMRSRNPIVVKRKNPKEDFYTVINEGKKQLLEGVSIVVFPQSTRLTVFEREDFNSLGVKLAKASKVPALPIALKTDFWANGRFLKDIGPLQRQQPIYIEFGKPILINGNGKEEHKQIVNFIEMNLRRWGVVLGS